MEGHGGDLEAETRHHHHDADDQHLDAEGPGSVQPLIADGSRHALEHRRAGVAEGEGHAVEEDGGGDGAQHQVLQARLGGALPAGEGCQRDQRQRRELQRDVEGDELAAGGQEHHADGGEEHEGGELGAADGEALRVGVGHEEHEPRRHGDQAFEEESEAVDGEGAVDGGPAVLTEDGAEVDAAVELGPEQPGEDEGGGEAEEAKGRDDDTVGVRHVGDDGQQRAGGDAQLGGEHVEVRAGHGANLGTTSLMPVVKTSESTAG